MPLGFLLRMVPLEWDNHVVDGTELPGKQGGCTKGYFEKDGWSRISRYVG